MAYNPLVRKELYFDYANYLSTYGKERKFYIANHLLVKELFEDARIRNILTTLINPNISVPNSSYLSYRSAYNALKNIDLFLRNSGAMTALSNVFYNTQPTAKDIYPTPIFIKGDEASIIDIEQYPETLDKSYNDPLTELLLHSRNTFYSNKSAKFVEAMQKKTYTDLGFTVASKYPNPYDQLAIDDFFASTEFNDYISALMLYAPYRDRRIAKHESLRKIAEAIKRNKFDPRFKQLIQDDNLMPLEQLLELKVSHHSLYSIKNLSALELVRRSIDWNEEMENDDQKIDYKLYNFAGTNYSGLSIRVPYSNTDIEVHLPSSYLPNNIFPLLYQNGISPSSLYVPKNNNAHTTVLLKSLEPDDVYRIDEASKAIQNLDRPFRDKKEENYADYVSRLKKRSDEDKEI